MFSRTLFLLLVNINDNRDELLGVPNIIMALEERQYQLKTVINDLSNCDWQKVTSL